jgi:hypothetical protein
MNLQICFMNETVSDTESPSSDTETASSPVKTDPEKMTAVSHSNNLPVKVWISCRDKRLITTVKVAYSPDLATSNFHLFFAFKEASGWPEVS